MTSEVIVGRGGWRGSGYGRMAGGVVAVLSLSIVLVACGGSPSPASSMYSSVGHLEVDSPTPTCSTAWLNVCSLSSNSHRPNYPGASDSLARPLRSQRGQAPAQVCALLLELPGNTQREVRGDLCLTATKLGLKKRTSRAPSGSW